MERTRDILSRFTAGMATAAEVHQAVCEEIIEHVGSTRASVWYLNAEGTLLTSACLADSRSHISFAPMTLSVENFPDYFDAVKAGVYVRAPDALNDPATACFSELYFKPLGIVSLLDFVIKLGTVPVAVLCCEHCDERREWSAADQNYLHNMAVLLRISFIVQDRENRRQVA